MLEQHLDKGGEWVVIDEFTVESDLINYEYSVELTERADAILVYVTLPQFEPTWERAGAIAQYWDTNGETYQTAFDRIRLQDKQVVEIQPLASSRLIFRPVEWLRGWTIQIRARLAPLSNRDVLNEVITTQQVIVNSSSGGSCNLDTSQAIADIHTKLDAICQHLKIGDDSEAEQLRRRKIKFFLLS